jgi:cytochrome c553
VSRLPPPTPLFRSPGRPPTETSTAELRECQHHGLVEFHRYRAGRHTFRWRCKRCVGEAVTRRHQQIRQTLIEEAGGRCAVCGYDRCVVSLHFHHVDPASKSFPVSTAQGRSLAAFREEAKKCVLVCANCHGEIEMGLIPSPPAAARYSRMK